jgi:hypothetical protein
MDNVSIFWLQILVSLGVFSLVTVWYVWPRLLRLPLNSALAPLAWVQVFRYVGMALLVKGFVDPRLNHRDLVVTAYGDLIAATLFLASILALRINWRGAIPLVWVANTWGVVDLLNAVRSAIESTLPHYHLASFWWVYVLYAPMVIVSHIAIYTVLFKSRSWKHVPVPDHVTAPEKVTVSG